VLVGDLRRVPDYRSRGLSLLRQCVRTAKAVSPLKA
jgi:hypothetical protein